MAFADSSDLLLTGGGEGLARLWHLATGEQVGEFGDTDGWVRTVAIDGSATRVALGCGPGDIYVYDVANGEVIAELSGHNGRVLMLGFTRDPDELVSAAADGTVRLWSLTGSLQLAGVRADASLQCAAFNPERGMVLASSVAGTVAIMIPKATIRE